MVKVDMYLKIMLGNCLAKSFGWSLPFGQTVKFGAPQAIILGKKGKFVAKCILRGKAISTSAPLLAKGKQCRSADPAYIAKRLVKNLARKNKQTHRITSSFNVFMQKKMAKCGLAVLALVLA